jgi:hypothetical protein
MYIEKKHTYMYYMYVYVICTCTIVLLYPKLLYQSKSLNEISLNPMGARDRQSTLRFEKIYLGRRKKNLAPKQKFGIILKTSKSVTNHHLKKKIY